jgi:hypothetical protein
MADHERMFSAVAAYTGKYSNVEVRNDLQAGTMTVVFKSPLGTEGPLVALKIYGTRNVEILVEALVDYRNFRRVAQVYSQALELLDCFHLIEVEQAEPDDVEPGKTGGLRIARAVTR